MKTFILTLMLALTAVSGVVAVSQPAAALQPPRAWNTGCGMMNGICRQPLPQPAPRPIHLGPPGGYTPLNRQ